jgi:hypothetical protein
LYQTIQKSIIINFQLLTINSKFSTFNHRIKKSVFQPNTQLMGHIISNPNFMKTLYFLLLITIVIFSCDPEMDEIQEPTICFPFEDAEHLAIIKDSLLTFAKKSTCTSNAECLFIGIGSKPCGGPREYLIYSSAIDTARLHAYILDYNGLDNILNQKSGAISDCSIPAAPDSIKCENGCVAYYQGTAYKENVCCN